MRSLILISGLSLLLLASCRKKDINPGLQKVSGSKVLVLNEGNFLWSNASFDLFDPNSGNLQTDVFKKANGKALGDVLQSGVMIDGTLWMVVNNSGKIYGIDTAGFTEKWVISGLKSPRYVVRSGQAVWVSDLYSGEISIYSLSGRNRLAAIRVGSWTEQMINDGKGMAVACNDGWLRRYDTTSYGIIDSLRVGPGLHWLERDRLGRTWALASSSDSGSCVLLCRDPHTGPVRKFVFPKGRFASRLAMSKNRDTVFFLSSGVCALPVNDAVLPAAPVFSRAGSNFYGLGCDPATGRLYVADAGDFVSRGQVYETDSRGNNYRQFTAGYIPASFVFLGSAP